MGFYFTWALSEDFFLIPHYPKLQAGMLNLGAVIVKETRKEATTRDSVEKINEVYDSRKLTAIDSRRSAFVILS